MSPDELRILRRLAGEISDRLSGLLAGGDLTAPQRETVETMTLICGLSIKATVEVLWQRSRLEVALVPGRN